MPHGSHELANALGDFSQKAEQDRGPRNRPITLYATMYETVIVSESLSVTASSGPWVWYDGSTGPPRLYWGMGVWQTP